MNQKERTERWKQRDPVAFYSSSRERGRKYLATPEGRARNRAAVKLYRATHRDELLDKSRARRAELRRMIAEQKDAPCMDCGLRFPAVCMDFDHRPGEAKSYNVSRMVGQQLPPASLIAEIAKCDLVCANCHRIRTAKRYVAGETAVPPIADPLSDARFRERFIPIPKELP